MSHWQEQLTALDVALIVLDGVLLILALGSAVAVIIVVASRNRSAESRPSTTAILCAAILELVLLAAAVPWFLIATADKLAMFGAETMLPMFASLATRLATPLLLALLVAHVVALGTARRLPRT